MKTQKRVIKRHPLTQRWMIWDAINHVMLNSFDTEQQAIDALQHFDAFAVGTKAMLPCGTPVMCNGHRGVIFSHYDQDQYEIRLKSGLVCTDDFEIWQKSGHKTVVVKNA